MISYSNSQLVPRNGHTLIAAIVARISGCASQKELSLDDQVDHAKEEIVQLYRGPIEYRVIATKGKGERVDRPELAQVAQLIRSGELDLLVMEDVGRLVRGAEAVKLWGIAVDHGVRCLAPNDCLDTIDETWEEELITACRDHVGHNAHTSKRLKKKLMNRFKKLGGAVALPIAGYVKPEDAKTYHDWRKDDSATETIHHGKSLLMTTHNCSLVADYFNRTEYACGPYSRRRQWNGAMVRRYYKNRLLSGFPGRGFRRTIKHHETGRRVSIKNPDSEPVFIECPHLAHLSSEEQDELIRLLDATNSHFRRKTVNGVDPLWQRPRKRTRFPGQHACCWYCGGHYVWGGNGMTENLMCSTSREWHCWNSVGFHGPLAAKRLVDAITSELYALPGFEDQFCELVQLARQDRCGGQAERWRRLRSDEGSLAREQANFAAAIAQYGPRPVFQQKLQELDARTKELARERSALERLQERELCLPQSTLELRQMLEDQFQGLAVDSPEFGELMRLLVPEFHVYLVRLLDGGHLLPRAKVKLTLAGIVPDTQHVPGLDDLLTRELTLDLFERPPQRERIREEAVRLDAEGLTQRQIVARLAEWPTAEQAERPKLPVVQQALALDRLMKGQGLDSPYVLLLEPPEDYPKLRRHKNAKYGFRPRAGYERPVI